jgi:hypothetical protein
MREKMREREREREGGRIRERMREKMRERRFNSILPHRLPRVPDTFDALGVTAFWAISRQRAVPSAVMRSVQLRA